jgi:hypothetical protein
MKKELTFSANSVFENVTYDKESDNWTFLFAENICINASGFWRLLQKNKFYMCHLIMDINLDCQRLWIWWNPLKRI